MLKLWTVIWTREGREKYGATGCGIIPLEDTHGIEFNENKTKRGRPKIRVADVYPFFPTEVEAEAYRRGNEDFAVVQAEVNITNG